MVKLGKLINLLLEEASNRGRLIIIKYNDIMVFQGAIEDLNDIFKLSHSVQKYEIAKKYDFNIGIKDLDEYDVASMAHIIWNTVDQRIPERERTIEIRII